MAVAESIPTDDEGIRRLQMRTRQSNSKEAESSTSEFVKFRNRDFVAGVSVFQQYKGGMKGIKADGSDAHQMYRCGIIDMLQTYTVQKSMEHVAKATKLTMSGRGNASLGISSIDPSRYARRFKNFMAHVLIADSDRGGPNCSYSSSSFSTRSEL
uniref:PIPK domain-containing protein n=1 Tax=Octactis speculum TaxID=3111310 RepID=A0A7S2B4R9_9STRA